MSKQTKNKDGWVEEFRKRNSRIFNNMSREAEAQMLADIQSELDRREGEIVEEERQRIENEIEKDGFEWSEDWYHQNIVRNFWQYYLSKQQDEQEK